MPTVLAYDDVSVATTGIFTFGETVLDTTNWNVSTYAGRRLTAVTERRPPRSRARARPAPRAPRLLRSPALGGRAGVG